MSICAFPGTIPLQDKRIQQIWSITKQLQALEDVPAIGATERASNNHSATNSVQEASVRTHDPIHRGYDYG